MASDDFIEEHKIECIPGEDLEIGWVLSENGSFENPNANPPDNAQIGGYEVVDLSDDMVAKLLEIIDSENSSK